MLNLLHTSTNRAHEWIELVELLREVNKFDINLDFHKSTNLFDIEQCRKRCAAGVDSDREGGLDGEAHEGARVLREQVGNFVPQSLV